MQFRQLFFATSCPIFTLQFIAKLQGVSCYRPLGIVCWKNTITTAMKTAATNASGTKSIRSFFTATSSSKKQRTDSTDAEVKEDLRHTISNNPDQSVEPENLPADIGALSETSSEPKVEPKEKNDKPIERIPSNELGWQPFDSMEPSWKARLTPEYNKPYFQRLLAFLQSEVSKGATLFPPAYQIFTALNLCPFDNVKVVVIGQDPYHGPGQAHGLAFSVQKGVQIPPSLRNMINEAINDPKVGITNPSHGNLECWSTQGVVLLNTVLTVRKGEANSHQKKGWEEFTDSIIKELKKKEGLVYLLWGKPAQAKCNGIDHKKNVVLTCSHPSPLSAYKTNEPFIGSRIFSRCNDALIEMGKDPIDWNIR